jgi:hypothetical protein
MTTSFPPTIPGDALFSNVQANSHIKLPMVAVEQETSVSTAVTANGSSVEIVTFANSAAAGSVTSFTLNNNHIGLTSNVQASIVDITGTGTPGTDGTPLLLMDAKAAGSIILRIVNVHPSGAFNANVFTINVLVVS